MLKNITLLCTLVFLHSSAHADIYQCYQLDGSLSFQDLPCDKVELEEVIQLEAINATTTLLPPTSAGTESDNSETSAIEESVIDNTGIAPPIN